MGETMDWEEMKRAASHWQVGGSHEFDLPMYRKWWQIWRPRVIGYRHVSIPGVIFGATFNPPLSFPPSNPNA